MAKKTAAQPATPRTAPPPTPPKPVPAARTSSGSISTPPAPTAKPLPQTPLSPRSSPQEIVIHVWNKYVQDTPSRTILLDVFMAWLVVIGVLQFVYCILAGNYVCQPLNSSWVTLSTSANNLDIALQRISVWVQRSCWTVRAYSVITNADF